MPTAVLATCIVFWLKCAPKKIGHQRQPLELLWHVRAKKVAWTCEMMTLVRTRGPGLNVAWIHESHGESRMEEGGGFFILSIVPLRTNHQDVI